MPCSMHRGYIQPLLKIRYRWPSRYTLECQPQPFCWCQKRPPAGSERDRCPSRVHWSRQGCFKRAVAPGSKNTGGGSPPDALSGTIGREAERDRGSVRFARSVGLSLLLAGDTDRRESEDLASEDGLGLSEKETVRGSVRPERKIVMEQIVNKS
mmetsp:Transcript_11937/g.26175  ORF Transcript_11937/g.26175 Transcript_11937/m.26175 type:complete len:154 (-) Transcript_11937:1946-2407(-)